MFSPNTSLARRARAVGAAALGVSLFGLGTATPALAAAPLVFIPSGTIDPLGRVSFADVNQDAYPDIIAVPKVYLGGPGSTFRPVQQAPLRGATAFGDMNGDGTTDLVYIDYPHDAVRIDYGAGDGTFSSGPDFAVDDQPRSVSVADLNRDGRADIVTGNYTNISVLLSGSDGHYSRHDLADPGDGHRGGHGTVGIADLNADGSPDLVVPRNNRTGIPVYLGSASGQFTRQGGTYGIDGLVNSVAVADMDHDGRPDVITAASDIGGTMSLARGRGDGTFETPQPVVHGNEGKAPGSPQVNDMNGDGNPDIVYFQERVTRIALGDGRGGFTLVTAPLGAHEGFAAVGDVNGDGRPDLIEGGQIFLNRVGAVPAVARTAQRCASGAMVIELALSDPDTPATALTLTARSSNATLLPQTGVTLSGIGAARELTVRPTAGRSGVARLTVNVSDGTTTGEFAATVRVGSAGDDTITGADGRDLVLPGDGRNTVNTLAGDDLVCGGRGDDRIDLGAGNDTAAGGDGRDIVSGGAGNDTVDTGAGDDRALGGPGGDTLTGDVGSDTLAGEAGDDLLTGGPGDDTLTGGPGADRFSAGPGRDTTDLKPAEGDR